MTARGVGGAAPESEWDSARHFVALYVAAGCYLEAEAAPSLMLVGNPGEGKSAMLSTFGHYPGMAVASDVTAAGLRDLLRDHDRMRVLMLPEFQRVYGHQGSTVDTLVSLLLTLMSGEGGRELVGPAKHGQRADLTGRRVAILSAVPLDVLRIREREFTGSGLMSRFGFLSLRRSEAERARVRRNIIRRELSDLGPYPLPKVVPDTPTGRVRVLSTPSVDAALERWIVGTFPGADARGVGLLSVLLRAVAFMCGRDRCKLSDVAELRTFTPHLLSMAFDVGTVTPREVLPLKRPPAWLA